MKHRRQVIPRAAAVAAAAALAAVVACAGPDKPAAATRPTEIRYGKPVRIARLANRSIDESSGVAVGRVNPGVFWTHNDSGDSPTLYAFNRKGEHLATVHVAGAAARDWEDICSFKLGGKGVLLIGDFGDNARARARCTLYAVHEPKLPAKRPDRALSATVVQRVHFRYADGAANCESVAFDPTSRTVVIVTKSTRPAGVYLLPWPKRPADEPVVLQCAARLDLPETTAMDISPDGRRAVVLTYGDAYEYARGAKQTWADAFKRKPRKLKMPRRGQGESICYGPAGRSLYLTSEGAPMPLWEVPAASP